MERPKERENERNAREAFIRILKKITGKQYEVESWPERLNRKSQDVEYILITKEGYSSRIAVEHTIVESFEKQLAYLNHSYDVVEELDDRCKGTLPIDRYYFLIVPHPLVLVGFLERRHKKQFVVDISSWVATIAKTLTVDQCSRRIYDNHEVTLWCAGSYPEMNGHVFRAPTEPEKAGELKRERFRRAIEEKVQKLRKYKLKGLSTALLLEGIGGSLQGHKTRWKDLTCTQKHLISRLVDYVVVLHSNNRKMIAGGVWKEEGRRPYSEIPQDRLVSHKA